TQGDPLFSGAVVAGCPNAIRETLGRPLEDAPGQKMRYSNVGYCLLGRVIEHVTGMDYEDAARHLLDLPETMTLGPPTQDAHAAIATLYDASWASLGPAGGWFSDAPGLLTVVSRDAGDASIAVPRDGNTGE